MPLSRPRNTLVASLVLGVVGGMVGLAFASVPLYQLFCQITGYGGTPQRAEARTAGGADADAPHVTVRFDANIADGLGWSFAPEQRSVRVRMGEEKLAFYVARNVTDKPLVGTATFNVTPYKAGPYFVKTACFCFEEQVLQPGEEMVMPVSFHVDPEMARDRDVNDVTTITLSYTFYPAKNAEPAGTAAGVTKPAG